MANNYTTRLKYLYKIGSCIQADLFPDGVGVAPLALPAPPPEATLEHPGVGLEVVVADLKVAETREGLFNRMKAFMSKKNSISYFNDNISLSDCLSV